MYRIPANPRPWRDAILNGVEHANFFETRATEYSKAATRGQWSDVWDAFDRRKAAKVASAAPAANEDAGEEMGGLFGHVGVAAE